MPLKPVFKQVESTVSNMLLIFIVAPTAGIGLSFMNGEIRSWHDLPKAIDHGLFAGFMLAVGWLGMASPYSARVRTLLSSIRTSDGSLEQRVELPANSSATATINPVTQQITVKEAPTEPKI